MKIEIGGLVLTMLLVPVIAFTQQADTLTHKLDSLGKKSDSLGNGKNNRINQGNYNERTKITGRTYFILLGSDFKQQVTLPFHAKHKDWKTVGSFALVAGALALVDEPINKYASTLHNNSHTMTQVSKYVTNFGGLYEGYTLAALGAYGFLFKNEKIKTTTLLATQAYITGGAIQVALKFLTGRQRPIYVDAKTNENDPVFHGPFYQFQKDANGQKHPNISFTSFPSGHTTCAFAAATVFAMEYRDRPIIPIISYSAATLIGLSRLTENKHWPTDVLVGAALGFLSGKQVVNNYHRYAKLQNEKLRNTKLKKRDISFNLNYFYGKVLPGITYKF